MENIKEKIITKVYYDIKMADPLNSINWKYRNYSVGFNLMTSSLFNLVKREFGIIIKK